MNDVVHDEVFIDGTEYSMKLQMRNAGNIIPVYH